MTESIDRRVLVHFPGFERMDAQAHHTRLKRTFHQAARIWGYSADVGPLGKAGSAQSFAVVCRGVDWQTSNSVYLCDHNALAAKLGARPLYRRIATGFHSAALVVLQGGLFSYFRHAWRFGLFFLFPFLLMGFALAICLTLATLPLWTDLPVWHHLWSIPFAWLFFQKVFLPFSQRFHTLHLFADWELAISVARLNDPMLSGWLDGCVETVIAALEQDAEEYVISSHSMGSSLAAHVLGMVLERNPAALAGKRVVFVTLGGAILQCALLRPATILRRRIGMIARAQEVSVLEVQCLTDIIHFYKSRLVALSGHPDAPQARIVSIRIKQILSPEHYRKIKYDLLRVHRQYVLPADRRAPFDFALMATGPFPAHLPQHEPSQRAEALSTKGQGEPLSDPRL